MIDFLIIGGGMAGASTAARIAPLGRTVLLEIEPALGYHASGRSAALYEAQYGEPATVVLNLAGRAFFDEHDLLSPRGFMVLAPKDDQDGFTTACATFGCSSLTLDEAQAIVPILNADHIGFAGLSTEAMDIDTDRMLQIFAKMARAHGGQILTDHRVQSIERLSSGWRVVTQHGDFEAKTLINAAGAWADDIAKLAGLSPIGITPKRRSMARIPAPGGHDVSGWPMLMDVHEKWYAKPDAGKLLVSPADEDPQVPHDAWADDMVLAEGIARYQPFVTEEVTRVENTWAGLRSFAPDKNLVIGPSPEDRSFFWMAGQGGSGIQSAPAYSQYAADLIAGRASDVAEITAAVTPRAVWLMKRKTPEGASFAEATEGAQLFAPSAARNLAAIASELAQIAPHRGKALEIASGTGQQVIAHAKAHPDILWQPSEIDKDRIASIDAYVTQAALSNLAPAIELDATASGWGATARYDLMLLSNLLHLISAQEAQTILTEAAQALSPNGRFMIYGPFMRGGVLTSEGDANFHASLRTQDPEIGYKDDGWLEATAQDAGLTLYRKTEMPANNLAFTFAKP